MSRRLALSLALTVVACGSVFATERPSSMDGQASQTPQQGAPIKPAPQEGVSTQQTPQEGAPIKLAQDASERSASTDGQVPGTSAPQSAGAAAQPDYLPPWNPPPAGGVSFAVPPVDAIADLHGDIVDPQLTVFFAGNQFMVVHDLLAAFRRAYPQYTRIYAETLPPGILARQIETGSLVMGNLKIELKPDVFTAGKNEIEQRQQQGWIAESYDYARNPLAILVAKGNPKHIRGLADLGRADVRVSMPNPQWEGVAKQIEASYRKAGGEALDQRIMQDKVHDGSTFLTQIHHRQSPLRVLDGSSDAAPVWATEAYFQQAILHRPVETVAIPAAQNAVATYTAARMKGAPHAQAARDFLAFMRSPQAQAIYRKYAFQAPSMDGQVPRTLDALERPPSMDGQVPRTLDALERPPSMDGQVPRTLDALERPPSMDGQVPRTSQVEASTKPVSDAQERSPSMDGSAP